MKATGGCYCGEIRYEINGALRVTTQCHCRECQYITGGNPAVFAVFSKNDFQYTAGKTTTFKRRDLVTPVVRHFCSNCGTAIGNKSPTNPNLMIVKVGTFDDQSFFTPMLATFTCDKQSYHYIPEGIPTFEKRRKKS